MTVSREALYVLLLSYIVRTLNSTYRNCLKCVARENQQQPHLHETGSDCQLCLPLFTVKYSSVIMSQTLIWHVIRDNNSFLVKRGRTPRSGAVQFSSEPGNLLNAHAFKYSGLANNNAVDVSSALLLRTKVYLFLFDVLTT